MEDGAHRPTCRERGSIFGKWSGRSLDALDSTRLTLIAYAIVRLVGTNIKGCHLGPAQSPKNQRASMQ